MNYQITVRFGGRYQRYHTLTISAENAAGALRLAADQIPSEIASDVDLVELRVAVDPDQRTYLGDDDGGP